MTRFFSRSGSIGPLRSCSRKRKTQSAIEPWRFDCCARHCRAERARLLWRRRWWWRSAGSWRRSCPWSAGRLGRLDLVADLGDLGLADFVEDRNYVPVRGQGLGAQGDFDILVRLVELEKPSLHVVSHYRNVIEIDEAALGDANRDIIFLLIWWGRRRIRAGQVDRNALHVGLAQADHHETRQEKEHDVDQRNDLDAGVLLWDGRSHSHRASPLVLRSAHRERDRRSDLGNRSRLKSPSPERACGRVVQDRVARTLSHLRTGYGAAAGVDAHDADAASSDFRATSLIRIFGTRRAHSD